MTTAALATKAEQAAIERAAWLAERRKGIGGSDMADLMQEDGGCQRMLWYDKRNTKPDFPTETTRPMLRGKRLEEVVFQLYREETGRTCTHVKKSIVAKFPMWARVNVDGRISARDSATADTPGVLEIKTAGEWMFRKIKQEGLPFRYILQIQHAMMVTGWSWGSWAVLWPDNLELLWFDVQRDDQIINAILAKGDEFWVRVENGPAPDPIAFSKKCRECAWRKTCPNWSRGQDLLPAEARETDYEIDDTLAELANDFKGARALREEYEALEEAIRARLEQTIGERTAIDVPSAGLKIRWKQQAGRKMYDTKALELKYPEIANELRKTSAPSRPFKIFHY